MVLMLGMRLTSCALLYSLSLLTGLHSHACFGSELQGPSGLVLCFCLLNGIKPAISGMSACVSDLQTCCLRRGCVPV